MHYEHVGSKIRLVIPKQEKQMDIFTCVIGFGNFVLVYRMIYGITKSKVKNKAYGRQAGIIFGLLSGYLYFTLIRGIENCSIPVPDWLTHVIFFGPPVLFIALFLLVAFSKSSAAPAHSESGGKRKNRNA